MRKFSIFNFQFSILVFAFYLLLITFYILPVYAHADELGSSRINPASPLYFLKSVREILELKFAGTTRVKAIRELEFATRRIREVKSLAVISRQDLIEPTLEKYALHLQELTGAVHPNDKEMVNTVNVNITTQINALQEVFKQVSDPKAKRSIRLAIFRISEKFAVSKPAACNFLQREASSSAPIKSGSALNEVERTVLSDRAEKCRRIL